MSIVEPYIIKDVESIITKTNELAKLENLVKEAEKAVTLKTTALIKAKAQLAEDMKDEKYINVQLSPNQLVEIEKGKGGIQIHFIPIHISKIK